MFKFNKKAAQQLKKQGYAQVPLLTDFEIKALLNLYTQSLPETCAAPFHTSHFSTNTEYKYKVHHRIVEVTHKKLNALLPDYEIVFSNLMIKNAGGGNRMPLHADWAYVKEPTYRSLAVWVPLVRTDDNNGSLGLIPYSQHLSRNIRGPRILQWNPPFGDFLIEKRGLHLPLPAGHAILYDHRLMHYSPANETHLNRPAINISLAPAKVPLVHYTIPDGKDEIHEFEVDGPDFYINYNNFQMPERGKLISILPAHSVKTIDTEVPMFLQKYQIKSAWHKFFKIMP